MAHSAALPGFDSPAVGFEAPFEMLAACHDRVRRSLALLQRLVEHVSAHGSDASARSAASDVLRYFQLAAPAHHEDEERHLVPRLLASGDAQRVAWAQRMLDDHAVIRETWGRLQPLLQAVSEGQPVASADLARRAHDFLAIHESHLPLEDEQAFPAASALVNGEGEDALAAMGGEMSARRRNLPPQR
jgi:hemerythrin-like domain-containing protein